MMECFESCVDKGDQAPFERDRASCCECKKLILGYNVPLVCTVHRPRTCRCTESELIEHSTCQCHTCLWKRVLELFGFGSYFPKPCRKEQISRCTKTAAPDAPGPLAIQISPCKETGAPIERFGARTRSFERCSKTVLDQSDGEGKDVCPDSAFVTASEAKEIGDSPHHKGHKRPKRTSSTGSTHSRGRRRKRSISGEKSRSRSVSRGGVNKTRSTSSTRGRARPTSSTSSTASKKGRRRSTSRKSRSRSSSACSSTAIFKPYRRRKSSERCASLCNIKCEKSPICAPPPCCKPQPCCIPPHCPKEPCPKLVCQKPICQKTRPCPCPKKENPCCKSRRSIRRSNSMPCGSCATCYLPPKPCPMVGCGRTCGKPTSCCSPTTCYKPCCPQTCCTGFCRLPCRSQSFHSTLMRSPSPHVVCIPSPTPCCRPCGNPCGRSRCRTPKACNPVVCPAKKSRSCPRPCMCAKKSSYCSPPPCCRSCCPKPVSPCVETRSPCSPGCCKPCCKSLGSKCPPCCTKPCCLPCPRKFTVLPYCPKPTQFRVYSSLPKCVTGSSCPCPAGQCSCPAPKFKPFPKPCCSVGCSKPTCKSVCCTSTVGSYLKAKKDDAICQMLLSKYGCSPPPSRCCPPSCFAPATCFEPSCGGGGGGGGGGCRLCLPCCCRDCCSKSCEPCENLTNSRRLCSPDGSKKQQEIEFKSSPSEKEPLCEFYLAPHCIYKRGPRSPVSEYLSMLRVTKPVKPETEDPEFVTAEDIIYVACEQDKAPEEEKQGEEKSSKDKLAKGKNKKSKGKKEKGKDQETTSAEANPETGDATNNSAVKLFAEKNETCEETAIPDSDVVQDAILHEDSEVSCNNNYGGEDYNFSSFHRSAGPVQIDHGGFRTPPCRFDPPLNTYPSSYGRSLSVGGYRDRDTRSSFDMISSRYRSSHDMIRPSTLQTSFNHRRDIRDFYDTHSTFVPLHRSFSSANKSNPFTVNNNRTQFNDNHPSPLQKPTIPFVPDVLEPPTSRKYMIELENEIESRIKQMKDYRQERTRLASKEFGDEKAVYATLTTKYTPQKTFMPDMDHADAQFIRESWKTLREREYIREHEKRKMRSMGLTDKQISNLLSGSAKSTEDKRDDGEESESVKTADAAAAERDRARKEQGDSAELATKQSEFVAPSQPQAFGEPHKVSKVSDDRPEQGRESSVDFSPLIEKSEEKNKDKTSEGRPSPVQAHYEEKVLLNESVPSKVPVFQSLFERFEETVHIFVRSKPSTEESPVDKQSEDTKKSETSGENNQLGMADWREDNKSRNKAVESKDNIPTLTMETSPPHKPLVPSPDKVNKKRAPMITPNNSCDSINYSCSSHSTATQNTSSTTIHIAGGQSGRSDGSKHFVSDSLTDFRKSTDIADSPCCDQIHEDEAADAPRSKSKRAEEEVHETSVPSTCNRGHSRNEEHKRDVLPEYCSDSEKSPLLNAAAGSRNARAIADHAVSRYVAAHDAGTSVDPVPASDHHIENHISLHDVLKAGHSMFQKVEDNCDPDAIRSAKAAFFSKIKHQVGGSAAAQRAALKEEMAERVKALDKTSAIATESLSELLIDFIRNNGTPV